MTVYSDLKLFRGMIKVIAESSDDPQTKTEAEHIDAYLVERVTQLQKAEVEAKRAEQPTPAKQRKIYRNGKWEIA